MRHLLAVLALTFCFAPFTEASTFSTTFTGTENPLSESGAFSKPGAWGALKKSSGAQASAAATWCAARYDGISFTTHPVFAQVTWAGSIAASDGAGLLVRTPTGSTGTSFLVFVYGDSKLYMYAVADSGALAFTLLTGDITVTQSGGTNTLRTETTGNVTIILFNGAVVYSYNHGALTTGQPSAVVFDNAGDGTPTLTSFGAGDLTDAVPGAPTIVGMTAYTNPNPLTTHNAPSVNTIGANKLLVYIGYHPEWAPGSGTLITESTPTDSKGNTYIKVMNTTVSVGPNFSMTGDAWEVTNPTNDAALVVTSHFDHAVPNVIEVIAIAGATGNGTFSVLTDPGSGGHSTSAVSNPINLSANSLVIGFAKNENTNTGTFNSGLILDASSYSTIVSGQGPFLWMGWKRVAASGSYASNLAWLNDTGWQTGVAGFQGTPSSGQSLTLLNTGND